MSYGVVYGLTGAFRILPGRTKLAVDRIAPSSDIVPGATPDTFVVQLLGYHQIDLNINLSSPSNNVPFVLELWNVTLDSLVQQRACVAPGQAFPSDQYFGFEWNNLSGTDEYAFYITPDPGIFYRDYALLIQDLTFRAVVQEFAGGVGNGTAGTIPKWTGPSTLGDSIMSEAGATITVAGAVNLAGNNTTTFMAWADGQNAPVSAVNTGRMRYNNVTHVFEVSENGGAWHDLIGIAVGTPDTVAKFNAPNSVGDSNITSVPTAVEITQASAAGGSPTAFTVTGGAHTTLAASVEAIDVLFDAARTVEFATGDIATQRAVVFTAPTYAFVGASTITDSATVAISGPPTAGANATLTAARSLWVQSGPVHIGGNEPTDPFTPLLVHGDLDGFVSVVVDNMNAGNSATVSFFANNDAFASVDLGINGSGFNDGGVSFDQANDAYIYANANVGDNNLILLAATPNGTIKFGTGGLGFARERIRITNTGLRVGLPSTNNGRIDFANGTNANLITIQSGVTSATYTLTLPTAQAVGSQVLRNDGAGVLSWDTIPSGTGTVNVIPKVTNATGPVYGDSSLTDNGTNITGALPIRLGPVSAPADFGSLFEAVYSAPAKNTGFNASIYSNSFNPNFGGRRARGTSAVPLPVLSGDVINSFGAVGYHSGGAFPTSANAKIQFTASENFTAIAQGTNINFWVTPIGTTTPIEGFQVTAAGVVRIGAPSTSNGQLAITNSSNANLVTLSAGVTAASYTMTLPTAQGGANTFLRNDGAGALSWAAGGASGTGTLNIIPKVTNATGPVYGDSSLTDTGVSVVQTQTVATSGSPAAWTLTAAAHTTLAAGAEASDVEYNLARTVQFATGAITNQRAVRIQAPTYAFVGASTITRAATLSISGPPIAGANATLTDSYALWIESGKVSLGTSLGGLGSIEWHNPTNSNEVVIQSGITAVSYTLVLPTAQASGSKFLENDGAGNLSWLSAATGAGTLNVIPKVTNATGPVYGNSTLTDIGTGITQAQTPAITGSPSAWTLAAAAHTTLTASTEAVDVNFNLARTVQFATGAIATQRAFVVQAPTYAFVGASVVTVASTVSIVGAPVQGANATFTNAYALWVQSGMTKLDGILNTGSGIILKQIAKTADYPMTTADSVILCDPTAGGTFTVTLPTAVGNGGQMFTIKHIGTNNTVIVDSAGGTIDGDATKTLAVKNSMTVISNGSDWFII